MELRIVEFAVCIRVVVLHERFGVRHEVRVGHVEVEFLEDLHQFAALQLSAPVDVKLVKRNAHRITRRRRFVLRNTRIRAHVWVLLLHLKLLTSLLAPVHGLYFHRCRCVLAHLLHFLARLLSSVHSLNLQHSQCLFLLLLHFPTRLLAPVHRLYLDRRCSLLVQIDICLICLIAFLQGH